MDTTSPAPLAARLLSGLLCLLLIVEPITVNAQVVAASGIGRPTVETALNGVPLVQIVAPNGAGVSHNVYQTYSVDARGVVLNNSQVVVATQQAGYIAGNPNLAAGSARLILNEITGTSPSDLRGFTEVAGTKADVVIANPNGITCNGCGFINTGRGVLTTGTPVFGGSGSLDAFRVTGGTIAIGANGLEGRYADQIDLLARSISVQGPLRANDLNVVAGANQVASADLAATPIAGAGTAPTTAIDVANVGGMYANKIRLISTDAGVGVNSVGTLVALAGDFRLDAAGNITLGGIVHAADNVDMSASSLTNTGSVFGQDITVRATNLTNQGRGVIAAGNSTKLYVTNTLANLDGGLIYSGGSLTIAGAATRDADGWLSVKTAKLDNHSADILAEGDIEIAASAIDNRRTTFRFETEAIEGSSKGILLAQEMDGNWWKYGNMVGRTYVNGRVSEEAVIPYGAPYWNIPEAASVPTFTILERDQGRRYTIVTEQLHDTLVAASAESRIMGRDIRLSADTLNNAASRIEASRDLTAVVSGKLTNDGARLVTRTRTTTWTGHCEDIHDDNPGWLGWCRSGWSWSANVTDSNEIETADSPASTITAAGNYTLNAETVSNGTAGAGSFGNPGRIGNLGNPSAYTYGLPGGGLYTVNPDGSSRYVVETDPRFTQFANFIGSDYMLGLLGLDPMATEKRLGDAYYEQQMVRDQLLKLRGKTDYRLGTTLNTEYQALLESGAEFAREFQLAPGVTLSPEQVAALSRDIVWLETRKVAGQDVLVPVVYLGASYTPRSVSALMGGGKSTTITATNDIINESGTISGQDVTLTAGHDIRVTTATTAVELHPGQTFTLEGEASRIDAQTLTMTAGNDLTLQGAQITADNATLQAGRDLTVDSQAIATEQHVSGLSATGGRSQYDRSAESQRSSNIDVTNDLTLIAGNDLTVSGSQIKAGNDLLAYAGNTLGIVTARETETLATSAYSSNVEAERQFERDTGKASSLTAGNNLNLFAGNTLYAEGAILKATGDASLQADTIVIAAAHDTYTESGQFSNKGKRGSQQSQTQIQTDEATGSIVEAGGDLDLQSTGDAIVEGSALAAGNQVSIDVSGDLKLLAAQSSRYIDLFQSNQNSKEATELKYHEEGVRQLLTTITVGTGANINVGGNFVAAIAEKNEDGSFKADRMTTTGIVKGDSRQQVDVKRTGEGATDSPDSSQVLGDLKAQGIRNGANDSFDPSATQTGVEALQAYLASGLIQVRNDPALNAKLSRILRNSEGATLTYKDDSGKVSLTVAGQAKVQEVFNTLKLTETFDKKNFADQQTAMIVTLIVAIVLTICTGGAAAGTLGAAIAGANTVAALMINAAIIGMASTMVGQLAGGASFDDAFQAGVKAGATSAVVAGIAFGASYAVDSLNSMAPVSSTTGTAGQTVSTVGETTANASGTAGTTVDTANTANNVNTVQSGTQTIEVGSKTAQGMNGVQKLTSSVWWEKTALNAVGQGAFVKARGGRFEDGFKGAVIGSLSATGAEAIGDNTTGNPFRNIASHAVLGCAVASASNLDCGSGALGGATSASLARVVDGALSESITGKTRDAIIAGTTVAGTAAIASASGKDMMTAANSAANEVTNNYLNHRQMSNVLDRLKECKAAGTCGQIAAGLKSDIAEWSNANDRELAACMTRECVANIQAQIQEANTLLRDVQIADLQAGTGVRSQVVEAQASRGAYETAGQNVIEYEKFQLWKSSSCSGSDMACLKTYVEGNQSATQATLQMAGLLAGGGLAARGLYLAGREIMAMCQLGNAACLGAIGSAATDLASAEALGGSSLAVSSSAKLEAQIAKEMAAKEAKAVSQWDAIVDPRKFSDYIFKPGADHGKSVAFESLGYSAEDSIALSKIWETQAAQKYASGEFTLGKADQYGQRITIEIELPGKGAATGQTSYMKSGWMIQSDGTLKLNTPFSGFTRSRE